jgi:hypothetical protein
MFHLRGQSQDPRTELVGGGADGVGDLGGVPGLNMELTAGAITGFEVEPGDYRPHRRDIRLVLHVDGFILDRALAMGAGVQRHVVGHIDMSRRRPMGGGMAQGAAGLLGALGPLAAAERSGLAVVAALEFVELLAQGLELLLQVRDLRFQCLDAAVALLASGASRR